jgi:patatin-like phospholipase
MGENKEEPHHNAFVNAVCLDLPYILDSAWRRGEFNLNRLIRYQLSSKPDSSGQAAVHGTLTRRPYTRVLQFWLFLATLVFVAYGPTFDAWCSIVSPPGMYYLRATLGAACFLASLIGWFFLSRYGKARALKRFRKAPVPEDEHWRRRLVRAGVQLGVFCLILPVGLFGIFLYHSRIAPVCRVTPPIPSNGPAWYQAILLLGVIALATLLARRSYRSVPRLHQQVALLVGMVAVLWFFIVPPWASEANQSPYIHTYGALACALGVLAWGSRPLARWQFGSVTEEQRNIYREALSTTELFPGSRVDPDVSTRRVMAALFTGVFYHLAQFLFFPSLFALMVPSRYLVLIFVGFSVLAAWLLMLGSFSSRWQAMTTQVRRWFLVGTPLAVSLGVIALAILRLAKVQYVATVLDAAPFGVIFVWVVMAYALLWWFEFCINRTVAGELIRVVGTQEDLINGYLKYDPTHVPKSQLMVERDDRYIVAHGAGRFAAVGWFKDKEHHPEVAFQTFELVELFAQLTPAGKGDLWHDLRRRIELYFLTINVLVVAILGAGFYYYGYGDRHNTVAPVVSAQSAPADGRRADLADLLTKHQRVFIVAASGGGTRAALFTATALEGLNQLGIAEDIVLLSGVSGGGVAEAYFYAHRDALLAAANTPGNEWQLFKDHMTDNFIGDVLEGSGEWRLMSEEPIGRLLVESFERRLFLLKDRQATLGETREVGLILNTTIAAHPQEDSDLLHGMFKKSAKALSCNQAHIPYALMGGGRLIFTNLDDRSAFPPSGAVPPTDTRLHIPDVRLPYVVVQDARVSMASAATLNSNFPPVFTNARVDVLSETPDPKCPLRSYYVTDGGATENLGLLSALYALRSALEKLPPEKIPEIHIVNVEASATAYDYTPDRGIDAATGGSKERLTGGLTQELLDEVQQLAIKGPEGSRSLQIHHLALPLAFRSRGGFGTHWMFPNSIVIENPRAAEPLAWYQRIVPNWLLSDPQSAVLRKQPLIDLWTSLHDPQEGFCTTGWGKAGERRVAGWVCASEAEGLPADIHITEWHKLIESLNASGTEPAS